MNIIPLDSEWTWLENVRNEVRMCKSRVEMTCRSCRAEAGKISSTLRATRGDGLASVRKMVQDLILKMQAASACFQ